MKLKSKFFILLAIIFIVVNTTVWLFSEKIISDINREWATKFTQQQVQSDKSRTLMPLVREIALARQLAVESTVIELARNQDSIQSQQKALSTLERYRVNFRDQSYFLALYGNGKYYFNDSNNAFAGKQLRYKLSKRNPNDQWFYATLKDGKPYQVNIDPDINLGVTKVWINALVMDGGKPIGIVGTGIDISKFLRETVDLVQPDTHNFFVDREMAIQLYRDASLIDFASLTKKPQERSKVDSLLTIPSDVELLKQAMNRVEKNGGVETIQVEFNGSSHIIGVAYLPEIGWFDLTIMDSKGLFLIKTFYLLPFSIALIFFFALLSLGHLLNKSVIKPIVNLNLAAKKIEEGDFEMAHINFRSNDEVGEITQEFRKMTLALKRHTSHLEEIVADRTAKLEATAEQLIKTNESLNKLSRTDKLTQLRNRFDLQECLKIEENRSARSNAPCGVVVMDIDYFKKVNDKFGHHAGDEVLKSVALTISNLFRTEDIVGRWGGEEFLILLPGNNQHETSLAAEKLRKAIEAQEIRFEDHLIKVSISQGVSAYIPGQSKDIEVVVKNADLALYKAKSQGRNVVVAWEE